MHMSVCLRASCFRVHLNSYRSSCLELLDVGRAEEELAIQVALFNGIHVRHVHAAPRTTSNSHHGPVLEHLAPDRARPNLHTINVHMAAISMKAMYLLFHEFQVVHKDI
jgi:hypothetical protein